MSNVIGLIFIAVGLVFNVVGCIGLVRMPNVYAGLQSAAKCVTLGTCSVLFGVFVLSVQDAWLNPTGIRALICIVFIVITAPAAAHALARGAHRYGVYVHDHAAMDKYEEEVLEKHEEGEKS